MHFEGQFEVPGAPDDVIAAFADVERMVKCMPGASLEGRDEDGRWLGAMLVAFGPKRITFKGKVQCAVDAQARRGTVDVRGGAQMRAAAPAEVHVVYEVVPQGPGSLVRLSSDAELGGVLADFARTGGVAVTQALMEVFAQRLAAEFSMPAAPAAERVSAPAAAPVAPTMAEGAPLPPAAETRDSALVSVPEALSSTRLLWIVLRAQLARAGRWTRSLLHARP